MNRKTPETPALKIIRTLIKAILILLAALVLFSAILLGIYYIQSHSADQKLSTSGQQRAYLLYVPSTYQPGTPVPLVISIHGYAEWPAHQAQISRWNRLAEEKGFIVVYPQGTRFPLRWATVGEGAESEVQFISDLIHALSAQYNIDPNRIYANGLSNGGGMSFLLSCRLAESIAAIGTVAGAYLLPWEQCRPARPVPLIAFHGTADPVVPYSGGPSRSFDIPFPNIPAWMETYALHNGCAAPPASLPPSGEVSGLAYTSCANGADVVFYTITGAGHTWPSGEPLPQWIAGRTSQDIDATRQMWQFFEQHPLE